MSYDSRFVYRVWGPVREEVRAALDERYGPNGWYSSYERALEARRRKPFFFEPSFVFRPADYRGYGFSM